MTRTCVAFATMGVALGVVGCDRGSGTPNAAPSAASSDPNVRILVLPEEAPALPDAAGKALVIGSCMTCHSVRYIADQPTFPRKTWTAEVDKMMKTYGAPIAAESALPIVDYLVATHGRED